jgi:hypothetical protein
MMRNEDDGCHYHVDDRGAAYGTKLKVESDNHPEGIGLAVANSTILKTLEIEMEIEEEWIDELLHGVARNRSIELINVEVDYEISVPVDFSILAPFFEHNANFRFLVVSGISTFETLVSVLPKCKNGRLQYIGIDKIFCGEEKSVAFFKSLEGIYTLRELVFNDCDVGRTEGSALAKLLKSPSCLIENLCLGCNTEYMSAWLNSYNVDDDGVSCIGDALSVNKSLKYLNLNWNEEITLEGWQGFASSLNAPNNTLQQIIVSQCRIDDEGARVIVTALAEKTSVNVLDMRDNSITSAGLTSIFTVLLQNKPSLEKLILDDNEIRVEDLTDTDWSVLSLALCDSSSINSTYSSNHNFHTLQIWNNNREEGIPEDIVTLLRMNKNDDKAEVAHQKILKHHFSGGDAGMGSTGVPKTLLPSVIEWMGRYKHGYSAIHNLVRGMPTLFGVSENSQAGMKRKRG